MFWAVAPVPPKGRREREEPESLRTARRVFVLRSNAASALGTPP